MRAAFDLCKLSTFRRLGGVVAPENACFGGRCRVVEKRAFAVGRLGFRGQRDLWQNAYSIRTGCQHYCHRETQILSKRERERVRDLAFDFDTYISKPDNYKKKRLIVYFYKNNASRVSHACCCCCCVAYILSLLQKCETREPCRVVYNTARWSQQSAPCFRKRESGKPRPCEPCWTGRRPRLRGGPPLGER